jgi:hypothetical protein
MVVERTRGRMAAAAAALAAALGCCCAVDQRFLRLGVGAACGRRPVRSRLRIAAALRRTRVGSGVAAVVPVVVGDRVIAVAAGGARLTVVHWSCFFANNRLRGRREATLSSATPPSSLGSTA